MLTSLSKTKLISLAITSFVLFLPMSVFAKSLTVGDQNFDIPENVISQTGSFAVEQSNLLTSDRLTLSTIFSKSTQAGEAKTTTYSHNPWLVYSWLKTIADKVNHPMSNPVFQMENDKVTDFDPGTQGQELNLLSTSIAVLNALEDNQTSVKAVLNTVDPTQSLASTNTLGIKELVTVGKSDFSHSSKNRRTNIHVGVSHIKGALIPPGSVFSFNTTLGDIDAKNGYAPEIVIKKTGLEPELGGGICQVSSTVFRSAFNGGFPIVQRKNHSFAVNHYAPQGTDATIYPGAVDLKFKNDTDHYLLIWPTYPDDDTLVFSMYGAKDDRKVTVKPAVQYDRQPDGSLKATWEREVVKNGVSRTDVIKSTYLSPALFKKEETTNITETPNITPSTSTPKTLLN
jgi:vancomycin resistance protein YoaR